MKVRIDLDLCQGHATCVEEAPEIFALDEKRSKAVLLDAAPPEAQHAKLRKAIRYCPTGAIRLVED